MAKPGRKTSYDLMAIIPGQRPTPPKELEPDEAAEWIAITGRLPADWFTGENIPMLVQLCRHIGYARMLAGMIGAIKVQIRKIAASSDPVALGSDVAAGRDKAEAALWERLRPLLKSHGDQSERIGNLSTKLRLSQLARTRTAARAGSAAGDAPSGRKPWEGWRDRGDDDLEQ
jgi:hypothetical protein